MLIILLRGLYHRDLSEVSSGGKVAIVRTGARKMAS